MDAALAGAAAQAVISAFIDPLVKKVSKVLEAKIQNEEEANLTEEIQRLANRLRRLWGYLRDAEEKQSRNATIRDWLADLEDIVYDAEDFLDDYAIDVGVKIGDEKSLKKS